MKPLCGLRCQFAVFPEFQNFHSVSFLLISALFRTALVDIVLVLAPWAAKGSVGPAAQEHLLAVLTQAQGLVAVHQHEAEHHLNTQQQGVKLSTNMKLNIIWMPNSRE